MKKSPQTIVIGRFGAPFGVKGWIKVFSFADPAGNILHYSNWQAKNKQGLQPVDVVEKKAHGSCFVAKIKQYNSPETVRCLTNQLIIINREQLPDLEEDEYYWTDLTGLTVTTEDQTKLGKIDHLFETGSNDVIVIKDDQQKEHLIPYTGSVVKSVDLEKQLMIVNWDLSEHASKT
jgi:16S rRNA processing protein RimM